MYLYRIHAVTFLPFRAYNTDNQLIIDTIVGFVSKSTIISKYVFHKGLLFLLYLKTSFNIFFYSFVNNQVF